MMDETTQTLMELNSKLDRMLSSVAVLAENQNRMSEDISKIKEAVYNPDEGLYARLRALEQWKAGQAKVQWIIISAILMMVAKQFWDIIVLS
jgi:seryl-tRNA synthetase|tara:strand:+ start:632 stop:907 length:276 start_codon:yes stop_codon:yes gene_type:complete